MNRIKELQAERDDILEGFVEFAVRCDVTKSAKEGPQKTPKEMTEYLKEMARELEKL